MITSIWAAAQTGMRVVKVRTTDGLSLGLILLTAAGTASWIVYGLDRGQVAQIVSNIAALLAWTTALIVAIKFDAVNVRSIGITAATCLVLSFIVVLVGGISALGLLATTWSIIGKLPQLRKSWIRPGGVAISLSAFGLGVTQSIVWIGYGALNDDIYLIATAGFAAFVSAFVMVRTVQGRRRAKSNAVLPLTVHEVQPRRLERTTEPEPRVLSSTR